MKVKDLAGKMANFGTGPQVIFIESGGQEVFNGIPDAATRKFGDKKVNSFVALDRGWIKIFID